MFIIDALLIGVALVLFALYDHVIPGFFPSKPVFTAPPTMASPTPFHTAEPSVSASPGETPEPTPYMGAFGAAFPDKFLSQGEPQWSENSYRSRNVSITVTKVNDGRSTYYVADIYIKDIENFKTVLADDSFGRSLREEIPAMAKRHNALTAITGDFYSLHTTGLVIRNGELLRDKLSSNDVCVLYRDGVMETYPGGQVDLQAILAREPYHAWSFGPSLLIDGQPVEDFDSSIAASNPRSAVGYYEPGHYCFVVVDGRQGSYSHGMTLDKLSKLMFDLGCKSAYNLDGGKSAMMTLGDSIVNRPYDGGRKTSDILTICEVEKP